MVQAEQTADRGLERGVHPSNLTLITVGVRQMAIEHTQIRQATPNTMEGLVSSFAH